MGRGHSTHRSLRALAADASLLELKQKGAAYDLAPPGAVELAEIVRKPAEAAGLSFERDEASGLHARRATAHRRR